MNSNLVSVIISTYNSSAFIVETLESISNQSWKPLELIISDDCSSDRTVDICREWIESNTLKSLNPKIITSSINTGISANANRGLNIAKGNWIKFLGADDTLKQNCIEDNMSWIESHPNINILFSRIEVYLNKFEPSSLIEILPQNPFAMNGIMAPGRDAESQYEMLLQSDRIHFTPSVFLHRETLLSVGGFDERFKLLEDYPLWLNLTRSGHKLWFMDKITVNYRRHNNAVNNTGKNYLINPNYFLHEEFRKVYTYPYISAIKRRDSRFMWFGSQVFRLNWLNKNLKLNRYLLTFLTVYINPFKYIIWLRNRFRENHN